MSESAPRVLDPAVELSSAPPVASARVPQQDPLVGSRPSGRYSSASQESLERDEERLLAALRSERDRIVARLRSEGVFEAQPLDHPLESFERAGAEETEYLVFGEESDDERGVKTLRLYWATGTSEPEWLRLRQELEELQAERAWRAAR